MGKYRLALAWLILGVVTAVGISADQASADRRLDPAIGPPIPEKYTSIRDARDWQNPYLSVCRQGVIVNVRSVKRLSDTAPIETLRTALLNLPVTAWPYGRIVALSDCSIGEPGDTDDRKRRMRDVEGVLKALGLEIDPWPS
jgi:hypothetical protein